jgi:hypothetical protein
MENIKNVGSANKNKWNEILLQQLIFLIFF